MSELRVRGLCFNGVGPIHLDVAAGSCVALGGPSGSGKTLLLRAMADLDDHQGEVYLDGRECRQMDAPSWRRRVAMLPAESAWWRDRVDDHFRVDAADLARVGLPTEATTWAVSRLSSGEKQRLALLRLLANHPRALLLDEPTSNLDQDAITRVEQLIAEYRRDNNAAVLWVTHDGAQAARVAEQRLRLVDRQLRVEEPT